MIKQLEVWKLILKSLEENIPVTVLYVLESSGSSPGRQGFFMAVNRNGDMKGSIGGGIMEHKFVEMAKRNIEPGAGNEERRSVRRQVHDKSASKDQSGMICSGEQTILIYPVQKKDEEHIRRLIISLEKNQNRSLILSPEGIQFGESVAEKNFQFNSQSETDWIYIEKTGYKNQLSIVGGGHCALAFSKLMSDMDFYIRVYDDRPGLKTMEENHFAHEKIFLDSYEQLKEKISEGQNHYVVIMTFGYRTDDLAVRALLGKRFKYFGLLGSRSKIEKMFDDYRQAGVSGELLAEIHSPIGIAIKSQTPEEIAVSIAAEIIKIKNENR